MQAYNFEPMSIGGILDRTFRIYRENFIRFVTILSVIQIPVFLLNLISSIALQSDVLFRRDTGTPTFEILGAVGMLIGGLLSIIGNALCQGALTKNVSEVYLGNEISFGQAYRSVLPKLATLIWASILVGLVVGFGFLLLVVPGVIFGLWFALTTPAIIVEDRKATQGMSRSKELASGNLGKIFAVGFLVVVIAWVIAISFSIIGQLFVVFIPEDNSIVGTLINNIFSLISQLLVAPIGAIAYILLYYDLRIRKEGFDLEMLANSIGSKQGGFNVDQAQPSNDFNE